MKHPRKRIRGWMVGLAIIGVAASMMFETMPAHAATGIDIGNLALNNVGAMACSQNSLGGSGFYSSCTGNGGQPEFWCADFARWVWANEGAGNTSDLNALAASFYSYGQKYGTLTDTAAAGDAAVWGSGGTIDHVGIITQVNGDGTMNVANGDWNGENGTESQFASTSHVVMTTVTTTVGSFDSNEGFTLMGIIAPVGISLWPASSSVAEYGQQVQVFGRASGGGSYSDVYTPGKGWSGWQGLGGVLAGDPTAIQYGSQMEVFGRTSGGGTYSDVYTPGKGWSGWQNLGGNLAGDPVAIQYGTQMQVFGRAGNGATYSDVYTPGKGWSGWQNLGGNLLP